MWRETEQRGTEPRGNVQRVIVSSPAGNMGVLVQNSEAFLWLMVYIS